MSDILSLIFENLIEITAITLSIFAIIFSGLTLYYNHLQGAKLRIEHLAKKVIKAFSTKTIVEHTISIVNEGNKLGLLKGIQYHTDSKITIYRGKVAVASGERYWKLHEDAPHAVIPIRPGDSVAVFCEFEILARKDSLPVYYLELILDKSIKEKNVENRSKEIILKFL